MVIRDLDIAEYVLKLAGPGGTPMVERRIPAEGMEDGRSYLFSGSLERAESLRLRPLP